MDVPVALTNTTPAQHAGPTPLAGGAPVAWGALAGALIWRAGSSVLAVARERTVGTPATFCTNTVTVDAYRVKEKEEGGFIITLFHIIYCYILYYIILLNIHKYMRICIYTRGIYCNTECICVYMYIYLGC